MLKTKDKKTNADTKIDTEISDLAMALLNTSIRVYALENLIKETEDVSSDIQAKYEYMTKRLVGLSNCLVKDYKCVSSKFIELTNSSLLAKHKNSSL